MGFVFPWITLDFQLVEAAGVEPTSMRITILYHYNSFGPDHQVDSFIA